MIRKKIEQLIRRAIEELQKEGKLGDLAIGEIPLEHPEKEEHGDYATPIALQLAKQLGKNPREVADLIISAINNLQLAIIDKVELAGPGFINFHLSKEYLLSELARAAKEEEEFGRSDELKGKKVMVEFTDPNPFKEFHIGHLYTNTVGESLSRILEVNGADVKRANYQGDVGMHVAKAILGMQLLGDERPAEDISLAEKVKWLGRCYALGAGNFINESINEGKGGRVRFDRIVEEKNKLIDAGELERINKAVYEKSDPEINELYSTGRRWSLEYFEQIYQRLGTKFDKLFFESEVAGKGVELVRENIEKGIFEKSEGAVIFPGEKYGLHNRVFINSHGLPTYEAKELGLAPTKYEYFPYDLSIVITGNEVSEYFRVLLAALRQIHPELAEKTKHIGHGMVRLPEGKMSSRTGNVITAEDFLEEVKKRARAIAEKSGSEVGEKEKEEVLEMVTVGAVKYAFLRVGVGKDIIFDFEKSLSLEGDSGPYLQYTHARCRSILRKAQIAKNKLQIIFNNQQLTIYNEELSLLRWLYRFPEIVGEAAENFSPNSICNFVFELAQRYNHFYNIHSVLHPETPARNASAAKADAGGEEQKQFRLLLTSATAQVIKNSLNLLGIKSPERM